VSAATTDKTDYRTAGTGWDGAWKIAAGVGVLGLAGAGAGFASDAKRFAFAYLFAFFVFLTIAIGATFFVLLQHLTNAGWSVTVRRVAEFFMSALPIFALLFLPIAANLDNLLPWWSGDHGAHHATATAGEHGGHGEHGDAQEPAAAEAPHAMAEGGHGEGGHGQHVAGHRLSNEQIEHSLHAEVMASKAWYLSKGFFSVRAVIYFLFWSFLAMKLFRNSTLQDVTKDLKLTASSQGMAPAAVGGLALTTTFAFFDWMMSLLPNWYSTIFGVQIFATTMVSILSVLVLVSYALRASGLSGKAITTEHFHDLGKLLFGFNVFWAYISFSQFFLIWYASIPEETVYFHLRWSDGPWKAVSLAIVLLHFVLPFALLLSRNTKRYAGQKVLALAAGILLTMHVVEMYWEVLPNYAAQQGIGPQLQAAMSPHWMDLACLLGVGGVYLAVVFYRMSQHPVVAVGDPRFGRSKRFENS
jgi:hypothetical protein